MGFASMRLPPGCLLGKPLETSTDARPIPRQGALTARSLPASLRWSPGANDPISAELRCVIPEQRRKAPRSRAWRHRLSVRTSPFQGGKTGSIPVGAIKITAEFSGKTPILYLSSTYLARRFMTLVDVLKRIDYRSRNPHSPRPCHRRYSHARSQTTCQPTSQSPRHVLPTLRRLSEK